MTDEDDSDVVVVAGTSSKTQNDREAVEDAIEDDVFSNAESNATSDSEGVVVSSGGARALSANSVSIAYKRRAQIIQIFKQLGVKFYYIAL